MGHAQVAFDFMRISIPAPSIPAIPVVAPVNASGIEDGNGWRWRMRGKYGGEIVDEIG